MEKWEEFIIMTPEKLKEVKRFQLELNVREFIDTGQQVDISPIARYQESCWGWEDVKKSLIFFIKRIEGKINGN